ncbi:unnamed protein product, partial [Closterium sp. NIES-54]
GTAPQQARQAVRAGHDQARQQVGGGAGAQQQKCRSLLGEFDAALTAIGITRRRTSRYHPQSDGLTERMEQTLKFSKQAALRDVSPYYLLYGREPIVPVGAPRVLTEVVTAGTPELWAGLAKTRAPRAAPGGPLATPAALLAAPYGPLAAPAAPRAATCDPPATPRPSGRLSCNLLAAPHCCLPYSLHYPAYAHPVCCAAMASLRVLAFDHEGRSIQFDTWLDNLQLYLLSDSRDSVSLFDHMSGAAPAPPATADSATRSQWLTRDTAARLAIRNHLPLAELAHFRQHRTAQALYDAVVARYSSPATAALGRLLLPYLFPELSAIAIVEDLISHLRTSDARYRAAAPADLPPIICSCVACVSLTLIVDLLEQHLLAAETSVGAARGIPRTPFFEGCSPSPLAPSYASAAVVDVLGAEDVGAASASGKRRTNKGKGGRGGGGGSWGGDEASNEVVEAMEVVAVVGVVAGVGTLVAEVVAAVGVARVAAVGVVVVGLELLIVEVLAVARGTSSSVGARPRRPSSFVNGYLSVGRLGTCGKPHNQHRCFSRLDDAWHADFRDEADRPRWAELLRSGVVIFDLDYDATLAAMCALSVSADGDRYLYVPPDPGIEAAALGAGEYALPSTAPGETLHTFTLDSGASRNFFCDSTTLTPLSAPVLVRLADPSRGPVLAFSSIVLLCPADALVTTTTPGGHRVSICTCTQTGRHLATFRRRPGSSLYTLATEPPQVAASAEVSASGPVAPPCLCRLLSHQTLLRHRRLGHPSLPRLGGMHSRLLVSGLPRSLPPLLPSPTAPCLPCIEGRQRAAPHSSSFPLTAASLQTLHMDVWGPARFSGQGRERYFLLVVDNYTRPSPAARAVLCGPSFPGLHFDRGGEFSSDLLRDFCRGEGILQSFTLPASPQKNGIAERCIGLVMEVARTSMIHAAAPHFLWPFAFYHPTSRRVIPSEDVTFDESVPFYRLFPYRSTPPPPPPLFLAPGPPPVDPLPPQGPGPSCVSQVDPLPGTVLVEVAVGSGTARGAASGGAEPGGAEPGGAESEGAGVWSLGVLSLRVRSLGVLSLWVLLLLESGGARAGDSGAGGAGVTAGAGGTLGAAAAGPRGARTRGTGAAEETYLH